MTGINLAALSPIDCLNTNMTLRKLSCPRCQAPLKLPTELPPEAKPKCPRCGKLVPIWGLNGALANSSEKPENYEMADTGMQPGLDPLTTVGIVGGTVVMLFLLAGSLLAVCFLYEDAPLPAVASVQEDDDPPSVAIPTKTSPKNNTGPRRQLGLTPAEEAKVEAITRRGVAYLKSAQAGPEKGGWPGPFTPVGETALAGLTLLECKVSPGDPAIQNAANFVRAGVLRQVGHYETYTVSVAILFLSKLENPADRPLIRSLALRLVASQDVSGGWWYLSPSLDSREEADLLDMLREFPKFSTPASLVGRNLGAFKYAKSTKGDVSFYTGEGRTDNSNTQFALLALWTARRYFNAKELDPPLRLVADRFRHIQKADGRWAYDGNREITTYPTMTAAGLLGLAVGYGLDSEASPKERVGGDMAMDTILQRGFRALSQRVGNPGQDLNPPPDMYFLWSVERVAVLFQLSKIDGKDWYRWGLEILSQHQQSEGKWDMKRGTGSNDIVDTCFALLFLQRANLAQDLTDKIEALAVVLNQLHQKE